MTEEQSAEELERARRYAKLRYRLALLNFLYTFAYLTVFLLAGISTTMADSATDLLGRGVAANALYLAGFIIITTIALAPIDFYSGYLLEHRFGLSNQTVTGWLKDQTKSTLVSAVIFIPLGLAAYWLLSHATDYWWLWAAALWTSFSFVLAFLAPVLIMPLFNKFEPIDSDLLRENILALANKAQVQIESVMRTDMSKRTKKANAYFTGLGKTKRIVLGDTLLDNYTHPEILTVVGHEMGHWKLGHLWKNTAVNIIVFITGFYLADRLLRSSLTYIGARSLSDIAGLPLIILAFMAIGIIGLPILNALSRHFERQADRFELNLVRQPEATISTFQKLARQNLADPSPHPVIEFLLYSHPSIKKRIALAAEYKRP